MWYANKVAIGTDSTKAGESRELIVLDLDARDDAWLNNVFVEGLSGHWAGFGSNSGFPTGFTELATRDVITTSSRACP